MKPTFLFACLFACTLSLQAQEPQLQRGNFMIETNAGLGIFGGLGGLATGGTGVFVGVTTDDGTTLWNVGGEFGYFASDLLAIKLGLGIGGIEDTYQISFKLGAKYYLGRRAPIQVDAFTQVGEEFFDGDNPIYVGGQAGYAFFLGDMVSLEPALRFNLSLNDSYSSFAQFLVGFAVFLF